MWNPNRESPLNSSIDTILVVNVCDAHESLTKKIFIWYLNRENCIELPPNFRLYNNLFYFQNKLHSPRLHLNTIKSTMEMDILKLFTSTFYLKFPFYTHLKMVKFLFYPLLTSIFLSGILICFAVTTSCSIILITFCQFTYL